MPYVNLIQEDRLAKAARDRKVRLLGLSCVIIGGLSFLGAGFFTFEAARLNNQITALEQTKEKIQPYIEQVEKNNAEIGQLTPRISTLTSAQERTLQWSRILDHLSTNMPDGVWLTAVTCQRQLPTEPIAVALKGYSTSNESVGYLIMRLEMSSDLEKNELIFTQERRTEKGAALEFEVKGRLVGSAPEEKAKTKEADSA